MPLRHLPPEGQLRLPRSAPRGPGRGPYVWPGGSAAGSPALAVIRGVGQGGEGARVEDGARALLGGKATGEHGREAGESART